MSDIDPDGQVIYFADSQHEGLYLPAPPAKKQRSKQETSKANILTEAASAHLAAGSTTKALAALEHASEDDPDSETLTKIGKLFALLQQNKRALTQYLRALLLDPFYLPALAALSQLHLSVGDHSSSSSIIQKALERGGANNSSVLLTLGRILLSEKRTQEARKILERAHKLSPEDHEPLAELGNALAQAEEHDRAITALKKALSLSPRNAGLLLALGLSQREAHHERAAITSFKAAAAVTPDDPRPHFEIGLTHYHSSDWPKASENFRAALKLDPNNKLSLLYLSRTYREKGKPQHAEPRLLQLTQRHPDYIPGHFDLTHLMIERGSNQEASEALARLASVCENTDWTDYTRRRAAELLSDWARRIHYDEDTGNTFLRIGFDYGAIVNREPLLIHAASGGDPDWLEFILAGGVDPETTGSYEQTALSVTVRHGAKACKPLLDRNANPHAMDAYGFTPIFRALQYRSFSSAEALFKLGVNANSYRGPCRITTDSRPARMTLLQSLVDSMRSEPEDETLIELLVTRYHADIEARDAEGNTALHTAAYYGNRTGVTTLLRLGANRRAENTAGHIPGQVALLKNHKTIASLLNMPGVG